MELILEEKWKSMEDKMEERWVRRKAIIEKRYKDILDATLQAKSKEMEEEMEQEFRKKQIEIQSRWKNKCDTIQEGVIDMTENALQGKCKEVQTVIEEMWREKETKLQEGWIRKMEKLEVRWRNILRETLKEKCRSLTENLESYWDIKDISLSNNCCQESYATQEHGRKENKFTTEENVQEKHMQGEAGMQHELQITENVGHLGNEVSGSHGSEEQLPERVLKRKNTRGCRKRSTNTNPASNSSTVLRNEIKNEATVVTKNTNVQASVEPVSQFIYESEGEMQNYEQYDTCAPEERLYKETEAKSRISSTNDVQVIQNTGSVHKHLEGESELKEQSLPLTVQTTKNSLLPKRENMENESGKLCSPQNQSTICDISHGKCLMEEVESPQNCNDSSTLGTSEHNASSVGRLIVGEGSLNNQHQSQTIPIYEQSATSGKLVEEEEEEDDDDDDDGDDDDDEDDDDDDDDGGDLMKGQKSTPTQADTKQKRSATFAEKLVKKEKEPREKENQDEPEEGDRIRFLPHLQLLFRHENDQQRVGTAQIRRATRTIERCMNEEDEDGAKRALEAEERRGLRLGRKLLGAARAGDADRLLALWHAGAYADAPDRRGETPLHAAAAAGHEMVMRALLAVEPGDTHSGGADPSARDAMGRTALHRAAARGNTGCVQLLLKSDGASALVNAQDARGRTALHEAAARGHTGVGFRLLESGASSALQDALGRTARDEADAALKRAKGSRNAGRLTLLIFGMY